MIFNPIGPQVSRKDVRVSLVGANTIDIPGFEENSFSSGNNTNIVIISQLN